MIAGVASLAVIAAGAFFIFRPGVLVAPAPQPVQNGSQPPVASPGGGSDHAPETASPIPPEPAELTYATEAFAKGNPFQVDVNPMAGYANPFDGR